tara:strand:- start:48 stop:506 length:459 start_codon:yes stop_codon:yes gene_type:complete
MIKKKFIKTLILLFFIYGCGYNPIFSNKNSNFSIYELSISGNNKLNKIINGKLNNYKDTDSSIKFSLMIETSLKKQVTSRDSKGNPNTYNIVLSSSVLIKDYEGNSRKKLFSKSTNYRNNNNKSELKKYENEISKNLAEKIGDEIILYLQSI